MKSLFCLALGIALAAVALLPSGAAAGPIIYRGGAWDRWAGGWGRDNYGRGYYNGSGYYNNGSGYYNSGGTGYYNSGSGYYGNGTGFSNGAPGLTNANIAGSGFTIPPTQLAPGLQPQVQGSATVNSQAMIWDPTSRQWLQNPAMGNSTSTTTSYYYPAQSYPAPTYYNRGRRR